jgi:F-type H+-transporting ATPase subunit delta
VNPSLQGYSAAVMDPLTGVDDSPADGPAFAELVSDLRSIDVLVETNAQLNAALTDTSVPPLSRRAVVNDLLVGKVCDPARRLAAFAAGAVSAPDLPAALNWLFHRARRTAEGTATVEPSLGHLGSRSRVAGFATAVFDDLSVEQLEELEDELFRFARTVEAAPSLRYVLSDRDLTLDSRHAIVARLLADKVSPAALALVQYTLTGGRPRDFVGTLDFLVEQAAKARGWRVARVRAAREVDEEGSRRLSASLSSLTGGPVELQVSIDPSLLSGVLVDVGDLRVDATARGRLDALREHLLTSGWEDSALSSDDDDKRAPNDAPTPNDEREHGNG